MAISFNDLHDVMAQRNNGLISKEKFSLWLDENLKLIRYIPLAKKYAIIGIFSNRIKNGMGEEGEYNTDAVLLYYDLNQLFDLLFAYTNVPISTKDRSLDNYDLIMTSGFFSYVYNYCGGDYEDLVRKCDNATGINTVCIMEQIVQAIGKQPTVSEMRQMANIINNDIDKDKLELIKTIQEYDNPLMKKVVNSISEQSAREVMNKVSKNEEK
nr:MAG TPA: hypothetical protein [Caudoviricetes sp.]DAT69713.1 MAG TPA: hypothetical protein [Caudoviricetes sp.]